MDQESKQDLLDFIEENKSLFENNAWEEIYKDIDGVVTADSQVGEFTKILLDLNFNPLSYMDYVPEKFLAWSDVVEVNIPNNIMEIRDMAFMGCKIKDIKLPLKIRKIGREAFAYSKIKFIELPNKLDKIEHSLFFYCSSLEGIYIPKGIKAIEKNAFFDCDRLRKIYYEGSEEDWNRIEIDDSNNYYLSNARILYNYSM